MINSKLPDTGTSIFSVMSALANAEDAINLSQGFPDFPIDINLKKKVIEALAAEQVQYAPMPGRLDLRQQIAKKLFKQHGLDFNPETEITITAGATQALYSTFTALVHPDDEVILFDPAYDSYDPAIKLHGGIPVHIELDFPSYAINWQKVKAAINSKTKLIVVNNPHNPAGSVLTQTDINELEQLVEQYPGLYILSDEVYEHMQYNGDHLSVLKSKILYPKSIVTYSFGKTFHVTGWKLGYAVAPSDLTTEIRKSHQFQIFCANNTMQYAISEYLKTDQSWESISEFYKKKRDLFLKEIKGSGLAPLACDGTYFMLFDYSAISTEPDVDFAKRMTRELKVATIPVSVFYNNKTDHKVVRICFAKQDDTLIKAAKILKAIG